MVSTIIPVTPIVKHVITKDEGNAIELSSKNPYAAFLLQSLTKNLYYPRKLHRQKYCERLTVVIGPKYFQDQGFEWPDEIILDFNNYVTRLFYKEFYTAIDFKLATDPEAKFLVCYNQYIEIFDIDPTFFSYERAKKSYYRYKLAQHADNQFQKTLHQTVPRKIA